MNSKNWMRKALSMCLTVAVLAVYTSVALAGSDKIAGELLVTGSSANGEVPSVKVNGEMARSGRSIFSSSTISTPENANAVVNLGKIGKIELAPNTTLALSFDENGISGDLMAGKVTVLNSSKSAAIKTLGGKTVNLNAGETAVAEPGKDDHDDNSGGAAWVPWALIFGGAIAAIVFVATTDNNRFALGGSSSVASPNR